MLDWYSVSVIIFVVFIIAILYKDRSNLERNSILFVRRTGKGKGFIKRIANSCPACWKWIGNAGIVIGFAVSVYIFYFMVESLLKAIFVKNAMPTLSVVVPSISSTTFMGPGYLAVPFWYWIISIALLVIVHEGFHGIMTVIGKTRIKALGWGVLAILPLAFVEPDEKQLAKKSLVTRLRVYAAGSLANFIFAGIYLLIFSALAITLFVPGGVSYQATIKDMPAYRANMTGVIIDINGHRILTAQDLTDILERIGENQTINITTYNGTANTTYTLETASPPKVPEFKPGWTTDFIIGLECNFPGTVDIINSVSSPLNGNRNVENWVSLNYEKKFWEYAKNTNPTISDEAHKRIEEINKKLKGRHKPGFIGIAGVNTSNELKSEYSYAKPGIAFIQGLIFFLFILNFGVGLANLLPIVPLDGGKMWEDLFHEYLPKKRAELAIRALSWITFLIIIAGFAIPFIRGLIHL